MATAAALARTHAFLPPLPPRGSTCCRLVPRLASGIRHLRCAQVWGRHGLAPPLWPQAADQQLPGVVGRLCGRAPAVLPQQVRLPVPPQARRRAGAQRDLEERRGVCMRRAGCWWRGASSARARRSARARHHGCTIVCANHSHAPRHATRRSWAWRCPRASSASWPRCSRSCTWWTLGTWPMPWAWASASTWSCRPCSSS